MRHHQLQRRLYALGRHGVTVKATKKRPSKLVSRLRSSTSTFGFTPRKVSDAEAVAGALDTIRVT